MLAVDKDALQRLTLAHSTDGASMRALQSAINGYEGRLSQCEVQLTVLTQKLQQVHVRRAGLPCSVLGAASSTATTVLHCTRAAD
jgi:hypothetical protein